MLLAFLPLALLSILIWPLAAYFLDEKGLRRFPNASTLSGVSNLSYILQRWRGFRTREVHAAHEKHSVVRIGPNTVSFSTPKAVKTIYGHASPCVKGGVYEHSSQAHVGLIDMIDKQRHAEKRRILSNAFATRNLEGWEFKVADKVRRLLAQFDQILAQNSSGDGDGVVDFRWWTNLFTVEAIADIAFSHRLGFLDKGDDLVTLTAPSGETKNIRFIESLHAARRADSMLVWTPWFKPLKFILGKIPGFLQNNWRIGNGFGEIVKQIVRQRVKRYDAGEELDDLFNCLLQDKAGQARDVCLEDLEGDATALLDAGSDTTAIALTHIMYFLLKNSSALSTLRKELEAEAVYADDGVAIYGSIRNLPYLRACLDESLRVLPPFSMGLNRVTPPEGLEIDGHYIAGSTIVVSSAYTAHRYQELFPDPEQFRPERWLEDDSKSMQAAFIPFSTGARGCIGRNITYIEQMILLASLVRRYDFQFVDDEWEIGHEEAFLLWPSSMPLKVQPRQSRDLIGI